MASPSRRTGWIIACVLAIAVLTLTAVVLWLWLPRWAPVWVARNSPWFDPAYRAVRYLPKEWSLDILAERISGRWDAVAQRTIIADLADSDPARRLRIVDFINHWVNKSHQDASSSTLIHVLRNDPDTDVRVLALESAYFQISSPGPGKGFDLSEHQDLVDVLIRLAGDPDARIRTGACSRLGAVNQMPIVIPILLAALRDPARDCRLAAIGSLCNCDDGRASVALLPLLDGDDDEIARAAWVSLLMLPRTTAQDARLARLPVATVLGWGQHVTYIAYQAALWDAQAIPGLVAALSGADRDDESRATICRALAIVLAGEPIWSPWEGEPLCFALSKQERRAARQRMVASALRQGVDVDATLLAACCSGNNYDLRWWALIGLRGSLLPAARQAALDALGEKVPDLVLQGALTLAAEQDDRAREPLIHLLADEAWKWSASDGLGVLGDQRAITPLIGLLEHWLIVENDATEAATALGRIGDHRAIDPLITALKSPHVRTRVAACFALEELGDRRAVPALIACLDDREELMRRSTVIALGKLGDSRAVPALIGRLDDPSPETRRYAANALSVLHDPRAVEPLLALLDRRDEKTETLTWAVKALARLPMTDEQRVRMCSPAAMPSDGH